MKVGIIGTGFIAGKMAETIQGIEGIENYAIASRSSEKANSFKEKWGMTKAFATYEEMLSDDTVDLVYVATPHSNHYEATMTALKAGKNVLCEKAFSVNAGQAEKMVAVSKDRGLLLAEAIWTRYMPSRQIIDELISSEEIGEIKSIDSNLGYPIFMNQRLTDPALAGGCLLDLTVYPLNFSSMFLGDSIKKMNASMVPTNTGVDGMDSVMIEYENGKMATMFTTMYSHTDRRGLITGEKGYIIVENINNPERIILFNTESGEARLQKEISVPEQITGYEYELLACKKALDAGKIECPEMPHSETIEIMRQMDEIRKQWGLVYPCE